MYRTEENLDPCDVFAFPIVRSNHYNTNIGHYCEFEAESLGHTILAAMVHDRDFTYFDEIEMFTLNTRLETIVNESIVVLSDCEDAFHPDVIAFGREDVQLLGFTLFNHLFAYHASFLQYVTRIFAVADKNRVTYVDFNLSEAEDKIILRLRKGINL